MDDYFKIMNDFRGFGNPDGKFWFIGIEEAMPLDKYKTIP